jgi:hypothetical protein
MKFWPRCGPECAGLHRTPERASGRGQSHGAYEVNVETLGRLTTPEEFNNVIVKSDAQGHITRIRDIGHAELGASDYGTKAYANKFVSTPGSWSPRPTPMSWGWSMRSGTRWRNCARASLGRRLPRHL